MKYKLYLILLIFMISMFGLTTISASQIPDNELTYEQCMVLTENDEEACEEYKDNSVEKNETTNRSNKLMYPFLSYDEETKELEKKELYYNYFWETHFIKNASEFDDTLFGFDTSSNTGVFLITMVANLLALISIPINLLNMVLISLYLNGSVTFLFESFTTYINNYILDWDNPQGIGIIITAVVGMTALIVKILKMIRQNEHIREIIKTILVYIMIIIAIPITYLNISPIEEKFTDSLISTVTSSVSGEDNTTVDIKQGLYDSILLTGWMNRHLGVSAIDQLATSRNISYEEAQDLVTSLLNGDNSAYKKEYENGNDYLAVNTGKSLWSFFQMIIWIAHDLLMLIIIGIPTILMFIVDIIFVFFKAFIWVGLFSILIKINEEISIRGFILNRFVWYLLYITVYITFIIFLKSIFSLTSLVVSYDIALIIIYDLIILVLLCLAYKQKDAIFAVVKNMLSNAGSIITGNGNYSAQQFIAESKDLIMENKTSIIKSDTANIETQRTEDVLSSELNDNDLDTDTVVNSSSAETENKYTDINSSEGSGDSSTSKSFETSDDDGSFENNIDDDYIDDFDFNEDDFDNYSNNEEQFNDNIVDDDFEFAEEEDEDI